ncbi:Crp/Fnr family transcriptional regulator [Sphingomonas radiodurans]|uniref:Crp/Fnr family transcriptional regulator n=1 Tax=Sphingomonas radiodurans TaxID=2890321 RepID=UPI001E32EBE4|nr:Crp/Fnr family transcriptional regulator [Sphingomonas radiodurans]WBH15361.1 Crp/Fnr family transcriptional regulator [Sphingomonas radiodurans]
MPSSCFAERLGEYIVLTEAEHALLDCIEERERTLRRGAALVREKDATTELFILKRGMMMSFVILDDGSRQILQFLFPGDIIAMSALAYSRAREAVTALSDSVVCPFDRPMMSRLACEQPRLFAAIVAIDQIERVALTDRLAGLGRTSAKARVAAILLEVRDRLRRIDPALGDSFVPGLTQEEIGDATGLTAVHVNRMLRQLEDEKMIARESGRVTILDEPRLARAANYVDRMAGIDLSWLPAAATISAVARQTE